MKLKQANAGVLTNYEVLKFFQSRRATSDPMGCLGAVGPSECKVFDYLVHSPASSQTKERIDVFMESCSKFNLANAEKLNIINSRPRTPAELDAIIEYNEKRLGDVGLQEVMEIVDAAFLAIETKAA